MNKPPRHGGGPSRGGNANPYHSGGGGFGSPQQNDSRTPFPSRTPMHSATPGWQAANSSRTPNPYADGGRTPAWNASSRTPNPYADGGRTPAWNVGSRTPNPYATGSNGGPLGTGAGSGWGGGGATPARPGGWQTPARAAVPPPAPAAPSWGAAAEAWGTSPRAAPTPWDSSWVGCFNYLNFFFTYDLLLAKCSYTCSSSYTRNSYWIYPCLCSYSRA